MDRTDFPDLDIERLTLFTEWSLWSFVVDDEFDDGPAGRDPERCRAAIADLVEVLDGATPRGPVARALADLWGRVTPHRSRDWINSFHRNTTAWLWSYYAETVDRAAGHVPGTTQFLEHRRDAIAMRVSLDLHEIAAGGEIPEFARHLPALTELRYAATDHIALYNDICSVRKELASGYHHNMVYVIHKQQNLTLQEAVVAANFLLIECVGRIRTAERQVAEQLTASGADRQTSTAVQRCVRGYRALVRGDFDYHAMVKRYTDPEQTTPGTPAYVADLFAR